MCKYGRKIAIIVYASEKIADRIDFERGEKSRSALVNEILDKAFRENPLTELNNHA